MLNSALLFLVLFFQSLLIYGQVSIKEEPIRNLSKNQISKILRQKSDFTQEQEWFHFDSLSNYGSVDTLVLFNSLKYFLPERNCYQDYWKFTGPPKSHLNIGQGLNTCKEPPGGGIITVNWLKIEKKDVEIYFLISDYSNRVIDKFKLLKVEYADVAFSEKPYRITLLRLHQY